MSDNEKLAEELLVRFGEHYKHSPTVMRTIEKVLKEVLGGDEDGTAQQSGLQCGKHVCTVSISVQVEVH